MNQPIEGIPGKIWRTAVAPARALAPAAAMARRFLTAEFWVHTEDQHPGPGPLPGMADRPDIQHPKDGAGPLNHRRYRAYISDAKLTPTELISEFRHSPNSFSPTAFAVFDPPPDSRGMLVGDEITIRLPGPWNGPIVVTDVEPQSLRFETRHGHMEAGWIRFSSFATNSETIFEIESIARSGDPAFEALYHPGKIGQLVQTEMWIRVLEAAASISKGELAGRPTVHTNTYSQNSR